MATGKSSEQRRVVRTPRERPQAGQTLARRLVFEPLEDRRVLNAGNLLEVPLLDGERDDPISPLINYLGGNIVAESGATIVYQEAAAYAGRGGYEIAFDPPVAKGGFAFVQTSLGATGGGDQYLDTRDLTSYAEIAFWIRNTTGVPFTLEVGIKDHADSNASQARYIRTVTAADQWVEVRAPLDLAPPWVGPAQAGWVIDGQPDLTRARSLSFVIVANHGSPVSGALNLDELRLVEPGEAVDPAVADVDVMVERLVRRQFDALWGMRDRTNGLVPTISAFQDVMATNVTAALLKSLPGAVDRGWISRTAADDYVGTLVGTFGQMMDKAHYLPARYVDRVSLEAHEYGLEESSVDAALLYLAFYQYQSQYETPSALRDKIARLLDRFDFQPFATSRGWLMAFNLSANEFEDLVYDGYTGEIGLISLAAHLAGQVDMAALYHSGALRDSFASLDGSTTYIMHSSDEHQSPFMQWLFPLFVDVSQLGPDTYPVAALASNPLANAIAYQQDVLARLDDAGRALYVQPDAGNDWEGLPGNYHQYSVFNDFGRPSLLMPWSSSFAFLADPAAAESALRQLLAAGLHGPFGLVDSVSWDDGQPAPRDVAARTDLWNAALALLAFQQYLYQDNVFLTSVPVVSDALTRVFQAPHPLSPRAHFPDWTAVPWPRGRSPGMIQAPQETGPAIKFLMDSANYYCTSPHDGGAASIPLYTEYLAGGDYFHINDDVRMTWDANDPNAARGRTSLRASWNGIGVNGYFQFGFGQPGPRDVADFGFAREVRFLASGDTAGQQVAVNVFRVPPGGGWQKLTTDPAVITLDTEFQAFTILLPPGIKPADLHAVQFVLGDGRESGGGTFWLDDVRLMTAGCDPARLIQSYRADPASDAARDVNVFPNRSFLYDNALAIKALWGTGDTAARATARQMADAIVATAEPDGSNYNQRNAGHVFHRDGTARDPYVQTRTLGDNAWFGLALVDLYEGTGEVDYLNRARALSDWAEANLKDTGSRGGYRGGYDIEGNPFGWRSTEHNADLFALNRRLAEILSAMNDPDAATYAARATHAGDFVMQMFDEAEGKFWTGTGLDDSINPDSVPLDAQLWTILALGASDQYAAAIDWTRPLTWAEAHLQATDGRYAGFTYSDQTTADRVWFEGTAHAAVTYAALGQWQRYAETMQMLEFARLVHPLGEGLGIVAASSDGLEDSVFDAEYDARLHVGATAWLAFAREQRNPFVSQASNDVSAPRAVLDAHGVLVVADSSYQAGLDPVPGFNLVSWWNFGGTGAARWEAAVQDLFNHGFRAVSLIPVRYVDLATGGISGGQKSPETSHIAAGILRAKLLGMTVTVNPMVEPVDFVQWRGEIQFDGTAADQFFQDYEAYLLEVAAAAAIGGADRMTVGSELKGLTSGHAAHWTAVIKSVATAFPGSLGYAANWDEYADPNLTAAIWESPHIDFLGVDLYPQLATEAQADASGTYPDAAFIRIVQANWERALYDLRDFAAARKSGQGMPVVLTEVGLTPYNRGTTKPYSDEFDVADAAEQTNAFDALLRATAATAPWLPEWYVWHWNMDGAEGSKFLIHPDAPLSQATAQLLEDHVRGNLDDFGVHTFTVTYTDNMAVDVGTLDSEDILVTGPDGYREFATLVTSSSGGNGTPRSATYRVPAPGGAWDAADTGVYQVLVQPNQVFDVNGRSVAPGAIGSFQVDPAPWQFHRNRFDVNADGHVVPLDVLILINEINARGTRRLPPPTASSTAPPPFFDVNGDNWLAPADVLAVINEINSRLAASGEGEMPGAFWSAYGRLV